LKAASLRDDALTGTCVDGRGDACCGVLDTEVPLVIFAGGTELGSVCSQSADCFTFNELRTPIRDVCSVENQIGKVTQLSGPFRGHVGAVVERLTA